MKRARFAISILGSTHGMKKEVYPVRLNSIPYISSHVTDTLYGRIVNFAVPLVLSVKLRFCHMKNRVTSK